METVSINVCSLCVPCANRCRYCLLSWDGKVRGADYHRSCAYARRFHAWLKENRPELSFAWYFGYSMEHPTLLDAIDFSRELDSPGGEFLQFDGMQFRTDEEIRRLLAGIREHGVSLIDLTFYGTREYHDRFAGRKGDFDYLLRILRIAGETGLSVNVGLALTHENADQAGGLLSLLQNHPMNRFFCFVPHGEGRGETLEPIRFRQEDYQALPDSVKAHFNRNRFKTEGEWIGENYFPQPRRRVLTVNLTPENIGFFESLSFAETISYLEELDEGYYRVVPSLEELAKRYGDPAGDKFYSQRDLYLTYQRQYIRDNSIQIHDINDETRCFSRRF